MTQRLWRGTWSGTKQSRVQGGLSGDESQTPSTPLRKCYLETHLHHCFQHLPEALSSPSKSLQKLSPWVVEAEVRVIWMNIKPGTVQTSCRLAWPLVWVIQSGTQHVTLESSRMYYKHPSVFVYPHSHLSSVFKISLLFNWQNILVEIYRTHF